MKMEVFKFTQGNDAYIAVKTNGFISTFPSRIKQIKGAQWLRPERLWLIPYSSETFEYFKIIFAADTIIIQSDFPLLYLKQRYRQKPRPPLPV